MAFLWRVIIYNNYYNNPHLRVVDFAPAADVIAFRKTPWSYRLYDGVLLRAIIYKKPQLVDLKSATDVAPFSFKALECVPVRSCSYL